MLRPWQRIGMAAMMSFASALLLWIGWSPASPAAGAGDEWKAPVRDTRKKNPIPADEGSRMTGRQVFAAHCEPCHGAGGKGDGRAAALMDIRPANLTSPKVTQQTDGALFWKISRGHRPMPTFEGNLAEEARWSVINYNRMLVRSPSTQPSQGDGR